MGACHALFADGGGFGVFFLVFATATIHASQCFGIELFAGDTEQAITLGIVFFFVGCCVVKIASGWTLVAYGWLCIVLILVFTRITNRTNGRLGCELFAGDTEQTITLGIVFFFVSRCVDKIPSGWTITLLTLELMKFELWDEILKGFA